MNWQPIETYKIQPFDADKWFMSAKRVLLWVNYGCVIGQYGYTQKGKGRWQGPHGIISPSHWMPLPEPPSEHNLPTNPDELPAK